MITRTFSVFMFLIVLMIATESCRHNVNPKNNALSDRVKTLESTAPGVGEVMTGVQLHFAKLFYAAKAENWKLANFEIDEVKENLENAAALRPEEKGVQLHGVVDAFEQTQIAALDTSVERHDLKTFRQNYSDAILVCNSCHRSTGRPFIIITEPTAPPVSNQQWAPPSDDASSKIKSK